jgi:hypothetical protein
MALLSSPIQRKTLSLSTYVARKSWRNTWTPLLTMTYYPRKDSIVSRHSLTWRTQRRSSGTVTSTPSYSRNLSRQHRPSSLQTDLSTSREENLWKKQSAMSDVARTIEVRPEVSYYFFPQHISCSLMLGKWEVRPAVHLVQHREYCIDIGSLVLSVIFPSTFFLGTCPSVWFCEDHEPVLVIFIV